MIINFNDIEPVILKNFNGGEKEFISRIFADEKNKILLGTLHPGASIGLHTHETNSEIIYVLNGKGKVLENEEYIEISTGSCHYCPKGDKHSLINDSDEDLVFFAVVTNQ